jgi:hypothetical protein
MMVNADRRAFGSSLSVKATMFGAGLLILLGTVLQLGVLGYDHVGPSSFWALSVFAQGLWNVLAMHVNAPAMDHVMRFWPLMIVSAGLGILMLGLERL